MFDNLLEKTFYGNTIITWLTALVVIILGVVLAKLVYYLFTKFVKVWTKRTKSQLDDILIDMIEEPIVFFIFIGLTWISLHYILSFEETVEKWISRIYYILVIFNSTWLVVRTLDAMLTNYIAPLAKKTETDLDDILLPLIRSALKFVFWTLAIVIGLDNAGYDVGAILASLGIGGVAVALAAKDTIANIFGGIVLITSRPFKVGERIRFDKEWADVVEIGLRNTKLIHADFGYRISIPNSFFLTNAVIVMPKDEGFVYYFDIQLSLNTPPEKIHQACEILADVVVKNKKAELKDVRFVNFDNHSFLLNVIVFVPDFNERLLVRSEIRLEIQRQFYINGIQFAEIPYVQVKEPVDSFDKEIKQLNIKEMVDKIKEKNKNINGQS